jgi:hypothetical protein
MEVSRITLECIPQVSLLCQIVGDFHVEKIQFFSGYPDGTYAERLLSVGKFRLKTWHILPCLVEAKLGSALTSQDNGMLFKGLRLSITTML